MLTIKQSDAYSEWHRESNNMMKSSISIAKIRMNHEQQMVFTSHVRVRQEYFANVADAPDRN